MSDHVLSGLLKKRSEIAGLLEHYQDAVRQCVIDLDNVDATIRLYKPDIDLEDVRPKPVPPRYAAYKGQVTRGVLAALRDSDKPLTSRDLALRLMADRGLNTADKHTVRLMQKRIGACLKHWRNKGVLCSEPGPKLFLLWSLAHENDNRVS